MNIIDNKYQSLELNPLQLLQGNPIVFYDICLIYQPTISEIALISEYKFQQYTYLLTAKPKDILPSWEGEDALKFLVQKANVDDEFAHIIEEAFRFFTHEKVLLLPSLNAIQVGETFEQEYLITSSLFVELQKVIRTICRVNTSEKGNNPLDERAASIAKKLHDSQAIVQAIKKKNGEDDEIDLATLVSSVGYKLGDLSKVFQMPYYAFFDQLTRMQYEEDYQNTLRARLAGAKISDDKMKYWIRRIKDHTGG